MKKKKTKRYSGIGGQAVLEGIMMKNKDQYSVAVRKPNGEIEVEVESYRSPLHDHKLLKIPFIRGMFNFADSLILGIKTLEYSATFFEEEETKETKADRVMKKMFKDKAQSALNVLVTIISLVFAIALFMLLPYYITEFLRNKVLNESLLAILEGVIRIVIFVLYVVSISLMKDIRRVYMYHGAEHKCINCIERGRELNVKNVKRSSRQHRRCGTSFLLLVMLVSVVLFFFIRVEGPAARVLIRLALIPVIAGIAYEIIRLAGRTDNVFVRIISAPGMFLQRLTTKEPDDDMIEVAIAAVDAIFDWRGYLKENFGFNDSDFEDYEGETVVVSEDILTSDVAEAIELVETVTASDNIQPDAQPDVQPDVQPDATSKSAPAKKTRGRKKADKKTDS